MPTTVADALAAAGLVREGVVRWGTRPPTSESGVYVVSWTDSLDEVNRGPCDFPASIAAFEKWLKVRPELLLDGRRPTTTELMDRVGRFWLPDEDVLYVGLAGSLASRVEDYFKTQIGARGPHSGGYFLKLVEGIESLWVHYSSCVDFEAAESKILRRFTENVSNESRAGLLDPFHPFPFANLEWPRGTRKAHGLRGAREPKGAAQRGSVMPDRPNAQAGGNPFAGAASINRTQRVTKADLQAGRLRIPCASVASTKALFPSVKTMVDVVLRGRSVTVSWDPRMGPDKERSGVLKIGPELRQLVQAEDVLVVSISTDGVTTLG